MKDNNDKNLSCQQISESTWQQSLTPLQQKQLQREKDTRDRLLGKHLRKEVELQQQGRGSQCDAAKGVLRTLVPAVAWWLDKHQESCAQRSNHVGQAIKEYSRLKSWIDSFTISHIGITVVLDKIGKGESFSTKVNTVQAIIGQQLEDQAFISYMEAFDPYYFSKLQKWYLHDPVRRYDKKVYAMQYTLQNHEEMDWKWMTEEEKISVGALVLKAIMSVPADRESREGFFESRVIQESKTKSIRYLAFSKAGIKYRDLLQRMANDLFYKPLPMLCEPQPWSLKERGGYLTTPPGEFGDMIHSTNPSVPSETALDALNRLQSQPYKVNQYIFELQKVLVQKTNQIGCFRSYEKETWEDLYFPRYTSEYIASLDKESAEYKKVMGELRKAYHDQKLADRESGNPHRILSILEEIGDQTFWTPWFFDSRLRLYPISEIGMTKGDAVKGLLVNANPQPITEDTKRELLIAIATSGGFKTESGKKTSKLDYFERYKWSLEFVNSGEFLDVVLNPINNTYWKTADEPFQFLAYCEEYHALFVTGERNTTRVWIGRDMTCSGIQILSSVIGDEKAMTFTNVMPGLEPQDAYGEVAREARVLLQDGAWCEIKIREQVEKTKKWNLANPDKPREERFIIEIDVHLIDRSVVKTQVMVTGYGGTYQAKRKYILEQLKKQKIELHPQDKTILVAACIEGMERAFPAYAELNKWFKQVASAACAKGIQHLRWTSPNGSQIVQDYREPLYARVDTHAASGGHYGKLLTDENGSSFVQTGFGDVKPTKHGSAIAANFTHTLDACMIQDGVVALDPSLGVATVHDCIYFQPGYSDQIIPKFRKAFYNVVTTPVLENLLEENDLEDMQLPEINEVDLAVCKDSPYMFS